jgi:hypothetical protein
VKQAGGQVINRLAKRLEKASERPECTLGSKPVPVVNQIRTY